MTPETLLQENRALKERVGALEAELKVWRQKVDHLLQRLYGCSSEKISDQQLQLLMGVILPPPVAAPVPEAKPVWRAPRVGSGRRGLPKELETEEVIIEPEPVKQAPELWKRIGQEVTEELDYIPARLFRRLYIRPKYVPVEKPKESSHPSDMVLEALAQLAPRPIIAPLPPRLIEKGYAGPGLLAYIAISKYEDHLPLFRQEKIFGQRYGVKLPRQMLVQWMSALGFWLKPIYEAIKKNLLSRSYLQVDETPIGYLDPDQPGKAQQGYLWAYSAPGADVLFDWQTTRGKEPLARFLKDFRGHLQSDAYVTYISYRNDRKEHITLVGCWSHCRRKFVAALEEDRRVGWFVRQIAQLYGIEKRLRESNAGPALRQAVRQAQAPMVLERINKALGLMQSKVLPKSGFGQAIAYAREQWESLVRYIENGRVEIDNNLIENAIRPTAIGKKNFLFIGHPDAGWYSAIIYSLLGSCRRHAINPLEYLTDILKRLPSATNQQIEQLTPAAWAKARKKPPKPDTW
jgi:transposase